MVEARLESLVLESHDDLLSVCMGCSIHDGTTGAARLEEGDEKSNLGREVEGRFDEEREVGSVVAGAEHSIVEVNVEAVLESADVFDDRGGGGLERRERSARLGRGCERDVRR